MKRKSRCRRIQEKDQVVTIHKLKWKTNTLENCVDFTYHLLGMGKNYILTN